MSPIHEEAFQSHANFDKGLKLRCCVGLSYGSPSMSPPARQSDRTVAESNAF